MRYTQTFLVAALAASASAFSLTDIETAREAETPAACFKALSADIDACSGMKVGGTCSSDCTAALKELSPKLAENCSTAFGNPGSLIRRLQDGYPLVTAVCGAAKSDDADDEEEKEDDKDEEKDDKTESATATSVKQQSTKLDLPEITRPAVAATGALVVDVGPAPTAKAETEEKDDDVKSMTLKDVTSTAASAAKSSSEASSSTDASSASESASVTESGSTTASDSTTEATQAAAVEGEDDADSAAGRVYIASGAMGMVAFAAAWLL